MNSRVVSVVLSPPWSDGHYLAWRRQPVIYSISYSTFRHNSFFQPIRAGAFEHRLGFGPRLPGRDAVALPRDATTLVEKPKMQEGIVIEQRSFPAPTISSTAKSNR
jgi:hypothetical protein